MLATKTKVKSGLETLLLCLKEVLLILESNDNYINKRTNGYMQTSEKIPTNELEKCYNLKIYTCNLCLTNWYA